MILDAEGLRAIVAADYAVPVGRTAHNLTGTLLDLLGSPDPSLREPTPDILGIWIERDLYTAAELQTMRDRMLTGLKAGLGERDTDSVFGRTFSHLVLASILIQDIVHPFASDDETRATLEAVLAYAAAERDLRGYVPGKGWAHAAAHTADMLWVLASHRALGRTDLERVLATIAALVAPPVANVYLHNEEERLAHAALGVLHRDLVPHQALAAWVQGLASPDGRDLGFAALMVQPDTSRRHNTLSFLRALYFQVAGLTYTSASLPSALPAFIARQIQTPPPCAPEFLPLLVEAIQTIAIF